MNLQKEEVEKYLELKRKKDPKFDAFGADFHQYKLLPCIGEDELMEYEIKYNFVLPLDYRHFILNISNGGAGPGMGLYSFQGSMGAKDETYGKYMATPLEASAFIPPKHVKDLDYTESGLLMLSQHGCGHDIFLVVIGDDAGSVWEYCDGFGLLPRIQDYPRRTDDDWANNLLYSKPKTSFSSWYLEWLQ